VIGEHALLINEVAGLCSGQGGWPTFMHDRGYAVASLEPTLTTGDGERATPDVVMVSNRDKQVILVECKGKGGIVPGQDRRYDGLETRSIVEQIGAGRFIDRHVVAYATGSANLGEIGGQTGRPIIVFSPSRVWGRGDFGAKQLSETLRAGVPLDGMRPPTRYYPFGLYDGDHVVIFNIVRGIVRLATREKIVVDLRDEGSADLLFDAMYELRGILPSRHAKALRRRIEKTVGRMASNRGLVRRMDEARERGDPRALGRLAEFCGTYLKEGAGSKILEDFAQDGEAGPGRPRRGAGAGAHTSQK